LFQFIPNRLPSPELKKQNKLNTLKEIISNLHKSVDFQVDDELETHYNYGACHLCAIEAVCPSSHNKMDAFKVAVKFYKPVAQLSHRQEVCRIYRNALREAFNWAESRKLFLDEAENIRQRFDANKNLPAGDSPLSDQILLYIKSLFVPADSPLVKRIIQEAYEELVAHAHPDPYLNPHMPGGTSFMRNPAIPLEFVYPSGIPDHYVQRQLNIDMSNLAPGQTAANKVFVDSVNKKYWIDK
jgi:NADH dehydrogenase (ubiquinone) 1 beta subcomplex subunit 9